MAADDTLRMDAFQIRPLRQEDEIRWRALWQGYLSFYRCSLPSEVTERTWQRLMAEEEMPHALVAVTADNQAVGFVIYHFHLSTWSLGGDCYLEDLFVAAESRGKGAGYALLEAVHRNAKAAGANRVYWHTHADNHTAQTLYDRVAVRSPFVRYQWATTTPTK